MKTTCSLALAFCLGAATIAMPGRAIAQDAADAAFTRGQALAKEGKIREAEAAFEEAWAGRKSWDIAGNLGLTEAELGQWEEAAEHLDFAITHIGGLATPTQRKALTERFEFVKSKVGTVSVVSDVVVEVKVGTRVRRSDEALYLGPGLHLLECGAEGYETTKVEVTVTSGGTQKVAVSLVKKAKGSGDPVKPAPEPRPAWPGWLMGGVGLATAGVGAALLGVGQAGLSDAEAVGQEIAAQGDACTTEGGGGARCAGLLEDLDAAGGLSTGGVVMLIAGGALLVGGIIYLVVPNEASQTTVGLAPWASPEGSGVSLFGVY